MKLTGYTLREALKRWQLKRDTAAGQFESSVKKFDDEQKDSPAEVMRRFDQAERAIAEIQEVQTRYNLNVTIAFGETKITLCQAVKLIGGAGRREKMWRSIAAPKKDRYGMNDANVRTKDQEVAKATITANEAANMASDAAKYAGQLRSGIAIGNAMEMDLDINGDLLA